MRKCGQNICATSAMAPSGNATTHHLSSCKLAWRFCWLLKIVCKWTRILFPICLVSAPNIYLPSILAQSYELFLFIFSVISKNYLVQSFQSRTLGRGDLAFLFFILITNEIFAFSSSFFFCINIFSLPSDASSLFPPSCSPPLWEWKQGHVTCLFKQVFGRDFLIHEQTKDKKTKGHF